MATPYDQAIRQAELRLKRQQEALKDTEATLAGLEKAKADYQKDLEKSTRK